MFLVMVNKDNLLEEMVLVTTDRDKAQRHFLDTCSERLSNWDDYTSDDKKALLDMGYENFGDNRSIVLIDTDGPTCDLDIAAEIADKNPSTEVHYVWKEWSEENGRLLTPWGDPKEYEYAFDFLFDTPEAARAFKAEHAKDEDWVLCKETLTPVGD